jgi:histidyl-tRNA synthetase
MADRISLPRGTADILPGEAFLWQCIESSARQVFKTYNYKEIRTPLFEETKLFKRSLGQASDVVNKQLLEIKSDKEEGFALRPEGTASIVRSYIENSIDKKEGLSKFFYLGPMFRGERPQKGRLRQFHQVGAEVIGPKADHPYWDAEIIALAVELLNSFGVKGSELKLNTLGTTADKEEFSKKLRTLLKKDKQRLCPDCQDRFERNVFRVLDCKNEACKKIVHSLQLDHSHLSRESLEHYAAVKEGLKAAGIGVKEDPRLVRGLDYYTHTVFEITNGKLGSQDAVGAGGRYNNLVKQLGGSDVPAIGFALGLERALLAREGASAAELGPACYLVALDEQSLKEAFKLLVRLRADGVSADMSYRAGSMKSLMREADKSGASYVAIIGENEIKAKKAALKNMKSGEQKDVAFDALASVLKGT